MRQGKFLGFFSAKRGVALTMFVAAAYTTAPIFSESSDERLSLRRISEFWREGEFEIAKGQIHDFLQRYPDSFYTEQLYAMLGDLYFKEGKYKDAADEFQRIQENSIQAKTAFNYVQCLFELQEYGPAAAIAAAALKESKELSKEKAEHLRYLLAESLFRQSRGAEAPEEKERLLRDALPHYKLLLHTKYADSSLYPLAECHRLLGESARAASLYATLAEKKPEQKEDLLFQAAALNAQENKEEAIKLFKQVFYMKRSKAKEAAYNALVLLFERSDNKEFLAFFDESKGFIPKDKTVLIQFYQGKILYALGDYAKCAPLIENYSVSAEISAEEKKASLLLLITCAKHLNERPLFDRSLATLLEHYPRDPETAKALLLHAQLCKDRGDIKQSLEDLHSLLYRFPDFEGHQGILYDIALLFIADKNWSEGRLTLQSFLKKYPNHSRNVAAWRHLVNCCVQEIAHGPKESANEKRMELINTIQFALEEKKVLGQDEVKDYRFLLIKNLYEVEKYKESLDHLTQYVIDYPNDPSLAEAYLLMGLCNQKLDERERFIENAERALSLNPQIFESALLHLHLFNEYLLLSQKENDPILLEKAASHLYASFLSRTEPIKFENHVWLANYYYNQTKNNLSIDAKEKGIILFETLFADKNNPTLKHFRIRRQILEEEALRLAELYSLDNSNEKKISLLEALVQEYKKTPKLPWKFQRKAQFELATTYEQAGEKEKAISGYSSLIKGTHHALSYITDAAKLQLARLQYGLLPEEKRKEGSRELTAILNDLKDLQIQRKIVSEPIHLEAALDYIAMKPLKEEGISHTLLLFQNAKEDFGNEIDAYLASSSKHPEKESMIKNYLSYIDAEIWRLKALLAKQNSEQALANEWEEKAVNQLNELLQREEFLTPYLLVRVQKSSEALREKL